MESLAKKQSVSEYDQVPYESYPYPISQIDNLYTIGKLFGLGPVSPKQCKVLEIGCASGGNIIPMALQFPKSEFVGIDLSKVQIEKGEAEVKSLSINNLSLKTLSIMDINKDFGEFDYIIAHGIISWVPPEVQDKIFRICSDNLSQKGIAYISYNTLPGWNMIKSIREMMLYHTNKFTNVADKVKQAKLLLEFIKDNNEGVNSSYTKVIEDELVLLKDQPDSYIAHDHLETNNYQFYLSEFVEKAGQVGLQYLGDATVPTMFTGNFPTKVQEVLKQVAHDSVRSEQYVDFLKNRRFRSTLLCKNDNILNRNIKADLVKEFTILSNVSEDKNSKDVEIENNGEVSFSAPNGVNFKTKNNIAITALRIIEENKFGYLSVTDLLEEVSKRIGKNFSEESIERSVCDLVLRLFLSGGMNLSSFSKKIAKKISTKPKVSRLAIRQAQTSNWITNEKSDKVPADLFSCFVIRYLDGSNNIDDLTAKIRKHVEAKEIILWQNEQPLQVVDDNFLKQMIKNVLDSLSKNFLLIG